jgi:hypothetical protein
MRDRSFWLNHALWPALVFGLFATVSAATSFDEAFARAWAFSTATGHFIGAGPGEWWAKNLLHSAGGLLIRMLGTIRALYAESKERNAIHASDSVGNGLRETAFFFAEADALGAAEAPPSVD